MATPSIAIEVSSSNGYVFTGSSNQDVIIYPSVESMDILIGTKSNAGPSLAISSSNIQFNVQPTTNTGSFTFVAGNSNFLAGLYGNGNFGLGTNNPTSRLDVNGDINFNGTLRSNGQPYVGSQWSNTSNRVFITGSNVGIGTANPEYLLHISSASGRYPLICTDGTMTGGFYVQNNSPSAGLQLGTRTNHRIGFYTNDAPPNIIIDTNGRLGIGTTNPTSLLTVNGGVDSLLLTGGGSPINIGLSNNGAKADIGLASDVDQYMLGNSPGDMVIRNMRSSGRIHMLGGGNLGSALSIHSNNNVGIRTTSPAFALDVNGDINFANGTFRSNGLPFQSSQWSNSAVSPHVFILGCNVGIGVNSPQRQLHVQSNLRIGATNATLDFGDDTTTQIVRTGTSQEMRFLTASTDRMTIDPTGRVGIGTTSPSSTLDIRGSQGFLSIINNNADTDSTFLQFQNSTQSARGILGLDGTGFGSISTGATMLATWTNHPLIFATNQSERVRITSTGRVGIGTSTPSNTLEVVGNTQISALNGLGADTIVDRVEEVRVSASDSIAAAGGWVGRVSGWSGYPHEVCWSRERALFVAVSSIGTGNRVATSLDGITWTARTSAADNIWRSVCWSAERGLFVAVAENGTGNRVMTSPDGITWTSRTSAADNGWLSVCWSPELGLFVAVAISGTGNRVMTSADGITWTARTSAANNQWVSVRWSPELSLFVAVAQTGNSVMTSPDGITWTSRTSATNNSWQSVCWSPERCLFVAVSNTGTGNRVMTSPDGITWTTRTSAADNDWRGVCWSPEASVFVAISSTNTSLSLMCSRDGINWALQGTPLTFGGLCICWSPQLSIFVCGLNSFGGTNILTSRPFVNRTSYPAIRAQAAACMPSSADAVRCVSTWTLRTPAVANNWNSVCWSPERSLFVAVAFSGTGNRVMTSPDGITWTSRTSAADNFWWSVCWSPELSLFVAVAITGTGNRVMTSPDGITWTARTSAADNQWYSVCWSPECGLFVAVAASGAGNHVMTSPDGITWTARTSGADNSWASVCWSPERGLFVAVAYTGTGNRVMTSPDGITWTARTSAANNQWISVCWSPERGLFVAVAQNGIGNRVMTSPDGIIWTSRASAVDNLWNSVCWSPELSMFVAVAQTGTGNRVMTSPDGITWTARTSAANNSWYSVCWSPELSLFASVSAEGAVMTSAIGKPASRSTLLVSPAHMTVNNTNGNVGIGTVSPSYPLHVAATITAVLPAQYGWLNSTGATGQVTGSTGSFPISLYASGRVLASEFNAFSDQRIKNNIVEFEDSFCADIVTKIHQKHYTKVGEVRPSLGFIAQEMGMVFPNCVNVLPGSNNEYNIENLHMIDYDQLISVLWGAHRYQTRKLSALEDKLECLSTFISSKYPEFSWKT